VSRCWPHRRVCTIELHVSSRSSSSSSSSSWKERPNVASQPRLKWISLSRSAKSTQTASRVELNEPRGSGTTEPGPARPGPARHARSDDWNTKKPRQPGSARRVLPIARRTKTKRSIISGSISGNNDECDQRRRFSQRRRRLPCPTSWGTAAVETRPPCPTSRISAAPQTSVTKTSINAQQKRAVETARDKAKARWLDITTRQQTEWTNEEHRRCITTSTQTETNQQLNCTQDAILGVGDGGTEGTCSPKILENIFQAIIV